MCPVARPQTTEQVPISEHPATSFRGGRVLLFAKLHSHFSLFLSALRSGRRRRRSKGAVSCDKYCPRRRTRCVLCEPSAVYGA